MPKTENAIKKIQDYYSRYTRLPPTTIAKIKCPSCGLEDVKGLVCRKAGPVALCECGTEEKLNIGSLKTNGHGAMFKIALGFLGLSAFVFGFHKIGILDLFKMGPRVSERIAEDPFQRAWIAYQDGQLGYSKTLALGIFLENGERNGDAALLLGHIAQKRGEYFQAIGYYEKAIPLFQNAQLWKLATVHYSIADVYLDLGEFELCEQFLASAKSLMLVHGAHEKDRLQVVSIEKDLLMALDRGEEAIEICWSLYNDYKQSGYNGQAAGVLSDIGMLEIRIGNYSRGAKVTLEAQRHFLETGDTDGYHYNLLNFLALERCRSGNWQIYYDIIKTFGDDSGNRKILSEIDKIFDLPCWQDSGQDGFINDGDKPPPIDDPPPALIGK